MNIYAQIYEFAASAGALEGYVYGREAQEITDLSKWVDNLLEAYGMLPAEALEEFQAACDMTLGRAVRSLVPALGKDHEIVRKLKSMISGELPVSPDDFQKKKWFHNKPQTHTD